MKKYLKNPAFHWLLFLILSCIWGGSFQLMKLGLKTFPYQQVGSLRIVFSGIVFLPFLFTHLKKVSKKDMLWCFVAGCCGSLIPGILFPLGETHVDASIASIVNALTPIFALLIGASLFKTKFKYSQWIGIFVGFAGILYLMLASQKEIRIGSQPIYILCIILATFLYGLNTNILSNKLKHIHPTSIAVITFSFLLIPALGIALWSMNWTEMMQQANFIPSLAGTAFLGIMCTSVASLLFFILLQNTTGLFAASVTYAIPIVGISIAHFSGETITHIHFVGLAIILIGIYLIYRK